MMGLSMQINNLPLRLTCLENGNIIIDRLANFNTIFDYPEVGPRAMISNLDIVIGVDADTGTVVEYGVQYPYKEMPDLLEWLEAHNMQMPDVI